MKVELKNPLTSNISLNPLSLLSNIGWVVGALAVFAIGQNWAKKASGKIPGFDTSIEPLYERPVAASGIQKRFVG